MDALLRWNEKSRTWDLYFWKEDEWSLQKRWDVIQTEDNLDYVHDGILSEIAYLQGQGYNVEIMV